MSATILPPPESTPVPRPRRDSYTAIKRTASGQFAMPPLPQVSRELTPEELAACELQVMIERARREAVTREMPVVRVDSTAATTRPGAK